MSKTARLDLRLEHEHKLLLEQAAWLLETNVSDFTTSVALDRARQVVAKHQTLTVNQVAFKQLLSELERPAKPLAALRQQLRKAAR
jgi:uncharacterized protein (DUF1778 family)